MLLDVEKLFPAESMTIMIVDYTKDNIDILKKLLTKFGFKITVALSGELALDLIPKLKPDLILLDVMMPGIDGYEVCIRLKKDKDLKKHTHYLYYSQGRHRRYLRGIRSGSSGLHYETFQAGRSLCQGQNPSNPIRRP